MNDHILSIRPSDQGVEYKVTCLALAEHRTAPCSDPKYDNYCAVIALWEDVGVDALEEYKGGGEVPWADWPIRMRWEGHGEDSEGWVVPVIEESGNDNPV